MTDHAAISDLLGRHERIGFQFSGGRDSLAALHLLRLYWDRITVYHLDTGDQFPETRVRVADIARKVPHFVRIPGRLQQTEAEWGLPTDIMPTDHTPAGRLVSGLPSLIDRYECCYRSLMAPMHQRMLEDGITLIIRGQRDSDYVTPPMRSGDSDGQIEVFYPIQDWTDQDVMEYLAWLGIEPTPFYDHGLSTTPECMTCSAWWDDGRAAYLKQHHPEKHAEYVAKLQTVRAAIMNQMKDLDAELAA